MELGPGSSDPGPRIAELLLTPAVGQQQHGAGQKSQALAIDPASISGVTGVAQAAVLNAASTSPAPSVNRINLVKLLIKNLLTHEIKVTWHPGTNKTSQGCFPARTTSANPSTSRNGSDREDRLRSRLGTVNRGLFLRFESSGDLLSQKVKILLLRLAWHRAAMLGSTRPCVNADSRDNNQ